TSSASKRAVQSGGWKGREAAPFASGGRRHWQRHRNFPFVCVKRQGNPSFSRAMQSQRHFAWLRPLPVHTHLLDLRFAAKGTICDCVEVTTPFGETDIGPTSVPAKLDEASSRVSNAAHMSVLMATPLV